MSLSMFYCYNNLSVEILVHSRTRVIISTIEFNNPDPSKPPTLSNTPPGLQQKMIDQVPFGGSDFPAALLFSQAVGQTLMRRAIFDTTLASILPNIRVRYFYTGETMGLLVLAAWLITDANPSDFGGVSARNIALHYAAAGNHFKFYDQPSSAIADYLAAIQV